MQPLTAVAVLALAASAAANPLKSLSVRQTDPKRFTLSQERQRTSLNCIPNVGCEPVDLFNGAVSNYCNAGGCGSQVFAGYDESWCDKDIPYCDDRTFRLVGTEEGDCKPIIDVKQDMEGQRYATIKEGDNVVGTCVVDFSEHYDGAPCGVMVLTSDSRVICQLD